MNNLCTQIHGYLEYCRHQKRLNEKSLKAYEVDLRQFAEHLSKTDISEVNPRILENYIADLHARYKPRTVKRKIASLKALFHYFEYREILDQNPFSRIQLKFREPVVLPKTIPLHTVESFLSTIYQQKKIAKTTFQKKNSLRDAAVIELLFATGMRISELCSLGLDDLNVYDGTILIFGKGAKERKLQIGNADVLRILTEYRDAYSSEIQKSGHFFANQSGRRLSEQTVRRMINKYTDIAAIQLHITPHMFRHTFATSLLEADVDIRYIQEMLGHSSIHITEIYTHVTMAKQRDILTARHPRKDFFLQN